MVMENRLGVARISTGGRVCLQRDSMSEFLCDDGAAMYPDCCGFFTYLCI